MGRDTKWKSYSIDSIFKAGKYEAVHPQSSWVTSLGGLANEMKATYKGKEEERRHHILNFICAR